MSAAELTDEEIIAMLEAHHERICAAITESLDRRAVQVDEVVREITTTVSGLTAQVQQMTEQVKAIKP